MVSQAQKGLFADKGTLVLRALLETPKKKWVVRELTEKCGVSLGLVSRTIRFLNELGYGTVERGRNGCLALTKPGEVLKDWVAHYDFSLNKISSLYSPDRNILLKLKTFLVKRGLEKKYALTLHSGANLITNYVNDQSVYVYLESEVSPKVVKEARDRLGLKQLVHGGNVHLIQPYYKNSVFYGCQTLRGFKVVSNLQLYLDLYHFSPRGREHADYLREILERKEKFL